MTVTSAFQTDYAAATEGVALFDASERGKLALTGTDAKEFLQGQVSQDIVALGAGHGCYAAFLTPKGKMLGDLRVLDTGEELLLDTERVALQTLFNMIRRYSLGYDVALHKRTLECGLLSLIGPLAAELVTRFGMRAGPEEHDHDAVDLAGTPARMIRTTAGVDLLMAAQDRDAVRAALLDAGAVEIGEECVECLRIEHGRPRYGVDLDDSVIPQEAGLNARAVSFTKGCYVGQETVARLFYKGKPNRELRGLRSGKPLPVGTTVMLGERPVATITSAAASPRFGPIALALVRREATVGTVVRVGEDREAIVSALPFD